MVGRRSWCRCRELEKLQDNVEKFFETDRDTGLSSHPFFRWCWENCSLQPPYPTTDFASLPHLLYLRAHLYCAWTTCISTSYLPRALHLPANSWRLKILISIASSWPIRVTCRERGVKAGDICWYFQLGWKQTNCTEVKCQRPLSILRGREEHRLTGAAFSLSLGGGAWGMQPCEKPTRRAKCAVFVQCPTSSRFGQTDYIHGQHPSEEIHLFSVYSLREHLLRTYYVQKLL